MTYSNGINSTMGDNHLSNEVFMSELTLMFHNARMSGGVTVTLKKYNGRKKPYPKARKTKQGKVINPAPLPESDEHYCLIRARHRKSKIATIVSPQDALKFQLQFTQFLRSNLDGLKKEKKPRKKMKKATQ